MNRRKTIVNGAEPTKIVRKRQKKPCERLLCRRVKKGVTHESSGH